jgi:hypothetical protein
MTRTAHCSCGALRVVVSADPEAVVACHCGECQRRTGSVFGVGASSKRKKFAPKDRPKSMSAMGKRDEGSECTFARRVEQRCSGRPTCGQIISALQSALFMTATSRSLRDRYGRNRSTGGLLSPTIFRT